MSRSDGVEADEAHTGGRVAGRGISPMTRLLLLVATCLSLFAVDVSPGGAQYLFTETNLDGACGPDDYLEIGTDTVWVWVDTNHTQDGALVACPTGEPLTIADYELCLVVSSYATGYHPASVGAWINKVPEFTKALAFEVEPSGYVNVHVYYSSDGATTHLPAGKRLLGGLEVTMTHPACNTVYVVPGATFGGVPAQTGFYSDCPGTQGDNRIRLGEDFVDSCVAGPICSGVESTTWGSIKKRYR
jgi:hypothetical protein